jgi:hypothetical protein
MQKNVFLLQFLFFVALSNLSFAALPTIYKGGQTLITSAPGWTNCSVVQTNVAPFEGIEHYRATYNSGFANFGLQMASNPNFSGYTHIRFAYKGLNAGQSLEMQFQNSSGTLSSIKLPFGVPTTTYQTVELDLASLTSGIGTNIGTIIINILNSTSASTLDIDAIELVNIAPPPSQPASATTWARANTLGKGFNTTNWLEAYWLLPYNTYPETNKYTQADFQFLKNAGFDHFRMPVCFEWFGSLNSPYTLNMNHVR